MSHDLDRSYAAARGDRLRLAATTMTVIDPFREGEKTYDENRQLREPVERTIKEVDERLVAGIDVRTGVTEVDPPEYDVEDDFEYEHEHEMEVER